jgi:rhodanese-related sulfurtransferase
MEAAAMKRGEAAVVDVREKEEWDVEQIPDAIHPSRGTIELEIEDEIKDICKSTSNCPILTGQTSKNRSGASRRKISRTR